MVSRSTLKVEVIGQRSGHRVKNMGFMDVDLHRSQGSHVTQSVTHG